MSMTAPIPELRTEEKPPFWRDVRTLRWVGQLAVVGLVVAVAFYLYSNLTTNIENSGLQTGWAWLDGKFGSAIPGLDDAADFTVAQAFWAGYTNTVRVILVGIPGCTIIGILIGVARLSDNLAVRAFGTFYVETFRNIPALVWIILIHQAIALSMLPPIAGPDLVPLSGDESTYLGAFVVSNGAGIGLPWFNPGANMAVFLTSLLVAALAAWGVTRWRASVNARTGEPARGGLYGTLAFLAVVLIGNFSAGNAFALEGAGLAESGLRIEGGMVVQIPYFSLTIALTLYTASHVAEIVRGAILAIHKGQTEAAQAIALTSFQRYRYIILPQAFRIMIPPLANQYLNITKNSSLAVAVGYIEITAIFSRVSNNAAPATSVIVILMLLYLSFSLSISLVANYFNRRLSLETR